MKERLERLLGETQLHDLTVGTFHAFCARLLRRDGPLVGIDRGFVIYDEGDQRALLRQTMEEQGVSERLFTPGAIGAAISSAKNDLKGPADMTAAPRNQLDRIAALVWQRYDALLRENNAVDFDDLLVLSAALRNDDGRARKVAGAPRPPRPLTNTGHQPHPVRLLRYSRD